MAAELFFVPRAVAFTLNGLPAAGAKLYFYLTGTTTPVDVYTTSALTTPHPNPITANGVGRVAEIYLDSTVTYRLVIKDNRGTTLYDADPYIPGEENISAIAFSQASTYLSSSAGKKLQQFIDPRDPPYSAVANGEADDAVALQSALNTGKRVWLQPEITYAFGTRLMIPAGGGFIGGGKLLMLTGTGKFDAADYAQSYDRTIGLFAESLGDIRIEARIEMQANAGIRTCSPIWIRDCSDVHLDVECWNFKETRFGIIEWNSNRGGTVKAYVHDCYTDSTELAVSPGLQITALAIDDNMFDPGTGAISSTGLDFNVQAKNLYFGSAALDKYGYQTDGVSLMGQGWTGHTGRIRSENVHEPLDIWSDGNNVAVVATNCLYGAKFAYGARHNNVGISVDLFANSGVWIGGSTTVRPQSTAHNQIKVSAKRGGQIGAFANVAAVTIDGSGDYGVERNKIEASYVGDGVNLDYGARIVAPAAANNTVLLEGSGTAVAVSTDGGTSNVVKRDRPSLVRANLSANATYANDATVICNTETIDRHGEYDPATGIFTATSSSTLRVKYKAQISVDGGAAFGSYIRKGATTVSRKRETNSAAAGVSMAHEHSAIVQVVAGDTIFIRTDSSVALIHFGGADSTYIEIEEI